MKWVKVAIGAVIAILSIGIIATSVYGMTQETTKEVGVVTFEILTRDGLNGTLTPGTYDLIDQYYMYYNEYTMFYRNDVAFTVNNFQYTDDFGGVFRYGINPYNDMSGTLWVNEVDGEYLLTGGGQDLQVGDIFSIEFISVQPPVLSGVTATLLLLAPLVFAGGVLAYLLNKQNY